jgi:hypothetical protein
MTSALRFEGDLNVDMNEFQTNLVPFPRLHFMTSSYAPLTSNGKDDGNVGVWELLQQAFKPENFNVKYADFDTTEDKYMAISMNFRGKVSSKDANTNIQTLKKMSNVQFLDVGVSVFGAYFSSEVHGDSHVFIFGRIKVCVLDVEVLRLESLLQQFPNANVSVIFSIRG